MTNNSKYFTIALVILAMILNAPPSWAQPPAARSEFEVASIKPNVSGDLGRYIRPAAGRFTVSNMTVKDLLAIAYQVRDFQVSGGPGWINSDHYDIEAKADRNATPKHMAEQMLQALLEDRFKLKVHRETKELPVYELTVAKNGLKIHPAKEGSCSDVDPTKQAALNRKPSDFCGYVGMRGGSLEATKQSISDLATTLSFVLGRTVVDKTGLKEAFDIHLEFAPNDAADSTSPSIFTAVQEQLGLKLESGKGPVEVLVIDQVEKPSEN
jgi:uncharacterized protein (TIGR03435 family)